MTDWHTFDIAKEFNPGIEPPGKTELSYHIVVSDGEVLSVATERDWRPLTQDEWRWCGLDSVASHYLGNIGGVPVFAEEADAEAEEPEGYAFDTLWSFLTTVEQSVFYLVGRATQLVEWHRTHHHCGACGGVTSTTPSDRSRRCEKCNLHFYPRLSPSIIVLVHKGDEVLLARNANARANFYSTLAGFVEPGESIEETVHREVFEEVGVRVKNLKYFSSQSWPFPNSLMLGFHAEYESGDIVIQQEEIADARWFHYEDMPNKPAMMSISGWLIQDFIDRRRSLRNDEA